MGHAFDSHAKGPTRRDQLTGAQRCLLDHILLRTYEIAVREMEMERTDPEGYARRVSTIRPALDMSSTSTVRGVQAKRRCCSRQENIWTTLVAATSFEDWSNTPNHISTAFRDIRSEMDNSNITLGLPKNLREDSILSSAHRSAKGALKKTALVFPVLFPSDLDDAQPIMEGLFAFMEERLVAEIRNPHGCNESTLQRTREERAKEGERLRQQLYKDVTKSWFLSKQEGIEAILRDSHNYEKFLENRGRASGQSYRRVDDWRQYVVEYLDYFGAQLLAVPIDDTDVIPQVSTDILHTLRIFLDHPRIVTIVAGNLRTLRQDLVWRAMSEVRSSMQALSASDTATAFAWRRFLRRQIEEYLDKVIPRPQRQYLKLNSFPPGDGKYKSDFERFLPSKSLDEYCLLQIRFWQKRFYEANIKANRRWINRKRETDSQNDRITLEHLLAWWLLRYRYKDKLGPRTPRELQTFVSYSSHDKELPFSAFKRYKGWQEKRLAVILFENAENYELIHRLEDGDVLLEWLSQQDLASEWVGHRSFSLDGRKISEGTYSYNYICYRLDLAWRSHCAKIMRVRYRKLFFRGQRGAISAIGRHFFLYIGNPRQHVCMTRLVIQSYPQIA